MKSKELVFIPSPGIGHLASTIEIAKLLINRHDHLSITVLTMKLSFDTDVNSHTKSLSESSSNSGIKFLELKKEETESSSQNSSFSGIFDLIDNHKNHVRDILAEISNSESSHLVGIVIDMFCTTMIDAANEVGVPSYVFYTSGAAMLGLVLHMQSLRDDFSEEVTDYKDLDAEIAIPTYINPVPIKVLPSVLFDKEMSSMVLSQTKRFRETKGIIINTFLKLESHAIEALSRDKTIPPIYPIGPILNLQGNSSKNQDAEIIMKWLDLQPDSSVVFLCFGSGGSFDGPQVKEIAYALEKSGYRFLWSLRRPPAEGKMGFPRDYENPEEVLPDGFLQRTEKVGKVIGWAPQVAVLSHPAVGGFVSHCGWNSTLESVWCGVPMATWPLYAEQQVNAFLMVKDLELAVEIKMDFKKDFRKPSAEILSADIIEKGIRSLMDPENKIRKAVKEMKEKSRLALTDEESSSASLRCFLEKM